MLNVVVLCTGHSIYGIKQMPVASTAHSVPLGGGAMGGWCIAPVVARYARSVAVLFYAFYTTVSELY